ncbi:MAG: 3-oxoadipate enol-lactonase 2 [Alphaproteobacteria bacterium MarineAlpha5_Bin11]|nr:MAG: 3-oxoadipate enol-lactonase 2 [Alphaproteobacteria bacterium MarineAlpha5_Bin11]PPR52211.1 MAG: 3-oxoadipate enol-lactonase 2 [Alphaproteobacteria bacterium MarineAlpha5_Bin10]
MDISYDVKGEGEPIIFVHGVGSRKYAWDGVVEKLQDRYQCVTYSLRGHGDSPLPNNSNDFNLDDLVKDLESLRAHLKLEEIHLVGHSLGGQIAPYYAKKYPELAKSLVMLSTAAFRTDTEKQKILDLVNTMKKSGLDAVLPSLINRWYTDEFALKNPDTVEKRIKMIKGMSLETFSRVFSIYANCSMEDWLYEINIPALVMTGSEDVGCSPRLNQLIVESMQQAELKVVQGLRHSINTEKPELVAFEIKNFIKKLT